MEHVSFLHGGKPTSVAAHTCILKMSSAGKTLQAHSPALSDAPKSKAQCFAAP